MFLRSVLSSDVEKAHLFQTVIKIILVLNTNTNTSMLMIQIQFYRTLKFSCIFTRYSKQRCKTNKSHTDRRRVCALALSLASAGWGSGMASPQVIKVCEVSQSVLCTFRRTSWLPDCVWRYCLMRYWLPIESMDFWFGSKEVRRKGRCTLEGRKGDQWQSWIYDIDIILWIIVYVMLWLFFFTDNSSKSTEIIIY